MKFCRTPLGFAREDSVGLRLLDKAPWLGGRETGAIVHQAERLVPVQPSKIICVGRNYRVHAQELGNEVPKEPLLFFKPPSALTLGAIVLPPQSQQVDYEAELGLVMGKDGAVFGLICVNDVTARDLQKKDGQWTRAKGFDTFCPVSASVVTNIDWLGLDVVCRCNGVEKQRGNTRDFVFTVPTLIAYIAQAMTLEPGDLILTGTPAGVGPLQPGDTVEVDIKGVGLLVSSVKQKL